MPKFRTLDDVNVKDKRVVIRLDLNVPIADGKVTDTTRIDRVVPTLHELLKKGAAVIILAHFDRPKGKVVPEMSLKPVAPALEKALGHKVQFVFTDWQSAPAISPQNPQPSRDAGRVSRRLSSHRASLARPRRARLVPPQNRAFRR